MAEIIKEGLSTYPKLQGQLIELCKEINIAKKDDQNKQSRLEKVANTLNRIKNIAKDSKELFTYVNILFEAVKSVFGNLT